MSHHTKTPEDSSTHGAEALEALLHRRIRTSPKVTKERFLASLANVQAASRRLQNETGVRNEEAWPTPSKKVASEIDQRVYAANVAALEDAIGGCKMFCVDMERRKVRVMIQKGGGQGKNGDYYGEG